MTQLLVSVRSAEEAGIAVASGADVIDVKEPGNGPLGRADDEVILAVQRAVAGEAFLSASLGELRDHPRPAPSDFHGFVKLGLLHCPEWEAQWVHWRRHLPPCHTPVLVAYANEPTVYDVVNFGLKQNVNHLLVDTSVKDGRTLLDCLQLDELAGIIGGWHGAGRKVAVAGSLTAHLVQAVLPLEPDFVGVRAAICKHGDRLSGIDGRAVERFIALLHGSARKSTMRTDGSFDASLGK